MLAKSGGVPGSIGGCVALEEERQREAQRRPKHSTAAAHAVSLWQSCCSANRQKGRAYLFAAALRVYTNKLNKCACTHVPSTQASHMASGQTPPSIAPSQAHACRTWSSIRRVRPRFHRCSSSSAPSWVCGSQAEPSWCQGDSFPA